MRRRLLLVALAVALSEPVASQAPQPVVYLVEGVYEGMAYTGRAEMVEGADGVVSLEYYSDAGTAVAIAFGIREGDRLATVFQSGGAVGVALFKAEGEAWVGIWTVYGFPGVFTERLTKPDPKLHGAELGPKSAL